MLQFAKNKVTNEFTSILDADKKEEYVCCSCGSKLIPKKGNIVTHHFAHYDNEECKYAQETALHQLCKTIFEKAKKSQQEFLLPSASVKYTYFDAQHRKQTEYKDYIDGKNSIFIIEDVEIEKRINDFQPDIVLTLKNKCSGSSSKLLVEIAVTHFIDSKKKRKIINSGLSCIEIDMSSYKDTLVSFEKISTIILSESHNKSWIYNLKENKALQRFKKEVDKKVQNEKDQQTRDEKNRLKSYSSEIVMSLLYKQATIDITNVEKYWRKEWFCTEYQGIYERRFGDYFHLKGVFETLYENGNPEFMFVCCIEGLCFDFYDLEPPIKLKEEIIKQCKDFK